MARKWMRLVNKVDMHADRPFGIRRALGRSRNNEERRTEYHELYQRFEDYVPHDASEPCNAFPGSIERIVTYQKRIDRGECLWHPEDKRG